MTSIEDFARNQGLTISGDATATPKEFKSPEDFAKSQGIIVQSKDAPMKEGDISSSVKSFAGDTGKDVAELRRTIVEVPAQMAVGIATQLAKGATALGGGIKSFIASGINDVLDLAGQGRPVPEQNIISIENDMNYFNSWPKKAQEAITAFNSFEDKITGVKTTGKFTKILNDAVQYVAEPYMAGKETLGSSGIALGKGLGLSPEGSALIATAGYVGPDALMTLFGFKPSVTAAKYIKNTAGTLSDVPGAIIGVKGSLKDRAIRASDQKQGEIWAKQISENMDAIDTIKKAQEMSRTIPGFKQSLGDVIGGKVHGEQIALARNNPQFIEQYNKQQIANKEALKVYGEKLFGNNIDKPYRNLVERSNGTIGSIVENINKQIDAETKRSLKLQHEIDINGTNTLVRGQAIQEYSFSLYKLKKARAETLFGMFDNVDVNMNQAMSVVGDMIKNKTMWENNAFPLAVEKLDSIFSGQLKERQAQLDSLNNQLAQVKDSLEFKMGGGQDKIASVVQEIDKVQNTPINVTIPLHEIKKMYTEINSNITREGISANAANEAGRQKARLGYLSELRKSIDNGLDNAEGTIGQNVDLYREAKTRWKTDVAEPFQEGIVGDVISRGPDKKFISAGDYVVKRVFEGVNTKKAGVKRSPLDDWAAFLDVAKMTPNIYGPMRDSIIQLWGQKVIKNGLVDEKANVIFMREHKSKLDFVPDIQKALNDVENRFMTHQETLARLDSRRKSVEDSGLYKLIATGSVDTLFKMLKDGKKAESLMNQSVSIGISKDSFKRIAKSVAYAKSLNPETKFLDGSKLIKNLTDSPGMRAIVGNDINDMRDLASAAKSSDYIFTNTAKPEAEGLFARFAEWSGRDANQITTNLRHLGQRVVGPGFVLQDLVLSTIATYNKAQVNEIVARSMLDPDLAKLTKRVFELQRAKTVSANEVLRNAQLNLMKGIEKRGMLYSLSQDASKLADTNRLGGVVMSSQLQEKQ